MRFDSIITFLLLVTHTALFAQSRVAADLQRVLDAEATPPPGIVGVYVKNLATGETVAVRGDTHFDSASTIKIAVLVMAFQLADQHKLKLDERYTVKSSDFRGGTGVLSKRPTGEAVTVRDLLTQMIINSDNAATDIMIAKLGGIERVNQWITRQGYRVLHLNKFTLDMFRQAFELVDPKYKSLTPEEVFALATGDPKFAASRIQQFRQEAQAANLGEKVAKRAQMEHSWLGVASPVEMGRLLEGIEKCTVASPRACAAMKQMLRNQQLGTGKIPKYLAVPVGHKTGEAGGVSNDVGIIYAHSGPIVVAFYCMGYPYSPSTADADERIAKLAKLVVDHFDPGK